VANISAIEALRNSGSPKPGAQERAEQPRGRHKIFGVSVTGDVFSILLSVLQQLPLPLLHKQTSCQLQHFLASL